jgi:ABC-type multidrug transport system ATPase subunit
VIARATKSAIIIVRNLTKRYNDYAVIDDISFDMRRMLVDSVQE